MDDPSVVVTEPLPVVKAPEETVAEGVRRLRPLLLGIELTLLGLILVVAAAGTSGALLGIVLGFVGLFVALSGA